LPESLPQTTDLTVYHGRTDLIRKTAAQIEKDFGMFGEKVVFSGREQTAYAELKEQIIAIVSGLYQSNEARLWNILYHIDVSEARVAEVIHLFEEKEDVYERLSHLIIERELKKVVIKDFYSSQ